MLFFFIVGRIPFGKFNGGGGVFSFPLQPPRVFFNGFGLVWYGEACWPGLGFGFMGFIGFFMSFFFSLWLLPCLLGFYTFLILLRHARISRSRGEIASCSRGRVDNSRSNILAGAVVDGGTKMARARGREGERDITTKLYTHIRISYIHAFIQSCIHKVFILLRWIVQYLAISLYPICIHVCRISRNIEQIPKNESSIGTRIDDCASGIGMRDCTYLPR